MYFLLACSGPGALATIRRNGLFSLSQAAVLGLLCWASLHLWRRAGRRSRVFPAICFTLLALHPTWMDGGGSGDCGYGMVRTSILFNSVALFIVVFQGVSAARSRRSQAKAQVPASEIAA